MNFWMLFCIFLDFTLYNYGANFFRKSIIDQADVYRYLLIRFGRIFKTKCLIDWNFAYSGCRRE